MKLTLQRDSDNDNNSKRWRVNVR